MDPATALETWPAARRALDDLAAADAVRRLSERDTTLWSDEPGHQRVIRDRLGWLDAAGGDPAWSRRVHGLAEEARSAGLDHVVLAGMGGSSLAPEVLGNVFAGGEVSLEVLDSTHPDAVAQVLDGADLARTLVLVASKSGTTEETRCFGLRAAALVPDPNHLVAITDPGSELAEQARAEGWRAVLENPPDIGGRYSALSLFGMAPAALIGIDVDEVWARAGALLRACGPGTPAEVNPAAQLAAFMGGLARDGRDKLTLLLSPTLASLGDWIEQLVAESTGKEGVGIVPIVGEPVGAPEAYGDDRAFVAVELTGEEPPGASELAAAGHPVFRIAVDDPHALGAEFVRWELATALAGVVLGVNPFDEPNVAESKANTKAVLADVAGGATLPPPEDGDPAALLATADAGDYLAVMCYLAPTPDVADALAQLRAGVRDRTGLATTLGWGPRFLHSTGQLHKGGPDSCVALQIVDAPEGGPDIPGAAYDFATLIRAQAAGDLRSLRDKGRRVVQVGATDAEDVRAIARRALGHA